MRTAQLPQLQGKPTTRRIDLHCHSRASTEADEAVLLALECPESYSAPRDVYRQAKSRGMDFVTITDHDSLAGVRELAGSQDVLAGEEVTCYFPEDHCKIHLLVWGLGDADHLALQARAEDIYAVSRYVAEHDLAHAVAHPLYRQNDKLERYHVERLMLLFNGFETLNGAHSNLHRVAFEAALDGLDEGELRRLERIHGIEAFGARPWRKTRTGGSDDHGLFNVGRTWTEFPQDVSSVEQLLQCIKSGDCRPGGEAGSSVKLAHNFYGVGMRFYAHSLAPKGASLRKSVLRRLVGDGPATGRATLAMARLAMRLRRVAGAARGLIGGNKRPARGTQLLGQILLAAAEKRLASDGQAIVSALREGRAPLAEHGAMFSLVAKVMRDGARGIADAVESAGRRGELGEIFDAVSAVLAQQALLLPYYFALFHQNQERHLLGRVTGRPTRFEKGTIKVGIFTDAIEGAGTAALFAREVTRYAEDRGHQVTIVTCRENAPATGARTRNFEPLVARRIEGWNADVAIPPLLEVMEFADSQQFDVVVLNTPGPMGLCGKVVGRMLRVPVISIAHDDVSATVFGLSQGDYRMSAAAKSYGRWFHGGADKVIARSESGRDALTASDVKDQRIVIAPPTPNTDEPCASYSGDGPAESTRLICPARLSHPDDWRLLLAVFGIVKKRRGDVSLVIVGEPTGAAAMARAAGARIAPASDERVLYHAAHLLVYPSRDDISAQAVVNAQASGLPAVVRAGTAAGQAIDHDLTGLALGTSEPQAWANAILSLLDDADTLARMSRTASQRASRFGRWRDMEVLWDECVRAAETRQAEHFSAAPASPASARSAEIHEPLAEVTPR